MDLIQNAPKHAVFVQISQGQRTYIDKGVNCYPVAKNLPTIIDLENNKKLEEQETSICHVAQTARFEIEGVKLETISEEWFQTFKVEMNLLAEQTPKSKKVRTRVVTKIELLEEQV